METYKASIISNTDATPLPSGKKGLKTDVGSKLHIATPTKASPSTLLTAPGKVYVSLSLLSGLAPATTVNPNPNNSQNECMLPTKKTVTSPPVRIAEARTPFDPKMPESINPPFEQPKGSRLRMDMFKPRRPASMNGLRAHRYSPPGPGREATDSRVAMSTKTVEWSKVEEGTRRRPERAPPWSTAPPNAEASVATCGGTGMGGAQRRASDERRVAPVEAKARSTEAALLGRKERASHTDKAMPIPGAGRGQKKKGGRHL